MLVMAVAELAVDSGKRVMMGRAGINRGEKKRPSVARPSFEIGAQERT
jgi:hypothetical protein